MKEQENPSASPASEPGSEQASEERVDSPEKSGKAPGQETQKDTFIRLAADFENYKKRTQREFSEQRALGKRELLEKLLSLSDTFELGLASAKDAKPDVLRGLVMIKGQLAEILKSEGVLKFGEVGETFDPFKHEAIEFVEGALENDGKIETVIQCGYSLPGGKILRHATVRVFKNGNNTQTRSEDSGIKNEKEDNEGDGEE